MIVCNLKNRRKSETASCCVASGTKVLYKIVRNAKHITSSERKWPKTKVDDLNFFLRYCQQAVCEFHKKEQCAGHGASAKIRVFN